MTLRDLAAGLGDSAQERAIERDVEAELAAHLALAAEALEAEGHAPGEARALARERFGDLERVRRECLRIRLGGSHAMKIALLVSNLVLVAALLVALLVARAQHVRAQEAMERAMNAQAVALEAAERARDAATPHGPVVVEVGDVIETFDQHRQVDFSEQVAVQPDGKVLLHDVGWVEVAGLTREGVENRLTEAYAPYYQDLTVNVIIHKREPRATRETSIPTLADLFSRETLGGATTVIEVGDTLEVFDRNREIDFGGPAQVAPDGQVLLPYVGWIRAVGLERDEFAQQLTKTAQKSVVVHRVDVILHKRARKVTTLESKTFSDF